MVTVFSKNVGLDTSAAPTGFRRGYAEDAQDTAEKIKSAIPTTTQEILEVAKNLLEMKTRLNRKEFSTFLRDLLCWTTSQTRKYLDIARVFGKFDFGQLAQLEPFLLSKLCGKRFAPVVERLREASSVTPAIAEELAKELLPKSTRKKKDASDRGDAILQKRADAKTGIFYYNLKEVNLSAEVGSWLDERLQNQTVGQVLASAKELERAATNTVSRSELEQVVQEKDSKIAEQQARIVELEAMVADVVSVASIAELETIKLEGSEPQANLAMPEPELEPEPEPEISFSYNNWEEVAEAHRCSSNALVASVKLWSSRERQNLSRLLSEFLEAEPQALQSVSWVPENLLKSALSRLNFSVQRIIGGDNPSEDPRIEMVSGCTLASLQNFGNRQECWIFELPDGKRVPIFGRNEFLIEVF